MDDLTPPHWNFDDRLEHAFAEFMRENPPLANAALRARLAEVEAERDGLRRFVEKAEQTFRHYGDLHAAKPDQIKAIRNYDLADEACQALGAKP